LLSHSNFRPHRVDRLANRVDQIDALFTNRVGHAIVYGVSNNRVLWWDNTKASFLGYRPQDSWAQFEGRFPVQTPTNELEDRAQRFQGGVFMVGLPQSSRS
jgi:uronate dehydrogenase